MRTLKLEGKLDLGHLFGMGERTAPHCGLWLILRALSRGNQLGPSARQQSSAPPAFRGTLGE
jgi:hypothetical protein